MKWISVKESLPKKYTTVLVCWAGEMDIEAAKDHMAYDSFNDLYFWENSEEYPPTHWMQLPEPPK